MKQKIQNAYIDHLLTEGKKPISVFSFAKKNKIKEEEFYKHFASFEAIEANVWLDFFTNTINTVKEQEVWQQYSSREKGLSFFYSFFELLKSQRSFVTYTVRHFKKGLATPIQIKPGKQLFEEFVIDVLQEGIESGELHDRRFLSDRYKDALWFQLGFLLNFWIKDISPAFEKTDEAIEKGVNVTFDLFQRSPIDNLLDYSKFLIKNAAFKPSF